MSRNFVLASSLILYTLFVTYIGYRNRRNQNSEDYFLASRNLPSWLLAISFIASWWGGGSAIDLVDHANRDGLSTFWIYGVPVLLSTALMYLFAAGIRRVGHISQSEIIEARYDSRSEILLTIFITIFMVLGTVTQVIVIGKFFSSFFNLSYANGAAIGTASVLIYSYFGGFRGVVLTDLLQFVFFLFSSIFLFIFAYNTSGGFSVVESYAVENQITGFNNFFHDLGDKVAYIVTFGTAWMVQANVWQRISAAKTPSSAKHVMGISFIVFIPLYLIVTLTGMLSRPLFETVPEGGIVAALLLSLESPILSGIIFIGLCSAIMSTMDSMLNTGALTLTIDLYKRYKNPNASEKQLVKIGRFSTLIIAVISFIIAIRIESVLTISWIGADFIATGAFTPIVLGFIWKRATSTAAFATMIFGLIFSTYNMFAALGFPLPVAWKIASTEQAIIGICCAIIIFIITTLLTKQNPEKADKFVDLAQVFKQR